jgi:hypothetical protein
MKRTRFTLAATGVVALLFLLTMGAPIASADVIVQNTLYCTGASSTSCFTTAPSGAYWTVETKMDLTSLTTFDFTLTVTANGGAAGYLQDFSGQYFYGGGQSVSALAWVQNAAGWTDLQASKAGNSGTCNGAAVGVFCGSADGTSPVALSSTPVVFELTGNYTGTFLSPDGDWHLQIAAANRSDGKGGNAFAISQDIAGTVPDGGMTLMLLGGALVGLETLRRRFRV